MKRITISVSDDVAAKVQRAVDAGEAPNTSAYFAGLVENEPDWVLGRMVVDEMIAEIGGLTDEEIARAEGRLGVRSSVFA